MASLIKFSEMENSRKKDFEEKYVKDYNLLSQLTEMLKETDFALAVASAEATAYRDSTVVFIENKITESLGLAFPNEKYTSKIEFGNTAKGRRTAELKLRRFGKDYTTSLQGGKLSQQLVSCSGVTAVNSIRGSSMMFLDEALASSDVDTVKDLSVMIQQLVDDGYQILLIEHKEGLYQSLARRHHYFTKNYPMLDGATSVSSEDYSVEVL